MGVLGSRLVEAAGSGGLGLHLDGGSAGGRDVAGADRGNSGLEGEERRRVTG